MYERGEGQVHNYLRKENQQFYIFDAFEISSSMRFSYLVNHVT